jgi:hypothetical protein
MRKGRSFRRSDPVDRRTRRRRDRNASNLLKQKSAVDESSAHPTGFRAFDAR